MDDEKLIRLVECNRELYDKSCPLYKIHHRKLAIWEGIAKELGTTRDLCIRRWTSLRDRYGRESRRSDALSGSESVKKKSWPLMDSMHFLKRFIVPRPLRCSQPVANVALRTDGRTPPSLSTFASLPLSPTAVHSSTIKSEPSPSPPLSCTMMYVPSPSSPLSSSPMSSPPPPMPARARKRKANEVANDVDKSFCEALDIFKRVCQAREEKTGNETVHAFGKMIVSSVLTMGPAKQARAMQRVTDIIMEMQREPEFFF